MDNGKHRVTYNRRNSCTCNRRSGGAFNGSNGIVRHSSNNGVDDRPNTYPHHGADTGFNIRRSERSHRCPDRRFRHRSDCSSHNGADFRSPTSSSLGNHSQSTYCAGTCRSGRNDHQTDCRINVCAIGSSDNGSTWCFNDGTIARPFHLCHCSSQHTPISGDWNRSVFRVFRPPNRRSHNQTTGQHLNTSDRRVDDSGHQRASNCKDYSPDDSTNCGTFIHTVYGAQNCHLNRNDLRTNCCD